MSTPISLLQMPKVPMQHIFDYLDFPSILVLRKVCHDLRNFIDDTKPPSFLKTIAVNMKIESTISLILKSSKNEIHIEYAKNEDGCVILCHKDGNAKEPILDNENFVTSFLKDFYIVLRHQKTVLEDFNIRFHLKRCAVRRRVLESLNKFLKSISHPLQVKSLDMEVDNHNEILLIFPYIDPKPLKAIHISEYPSSRGNMFNLDEIGQLEQWKRADELKIYGFRLKNLSQNVKHFSKIESLFRPFNTKELILLKEIFFSSTTLHPLKHHQLALNYSSPQNIIWVTDELLLKQILKTKSSSTPTPDEVPFKFLKLVAHTIASPLSQIFNLSMMRGEVPTKWKTSIILPLKKISKPIKATDYRPISITSQLCRIYERCILSQLLPFLDQIHFWNREQHGFRAKRSTTSCMLESLNEWTKSLDEGRQVDMIYMDYAKAFDKVDHNILLDKLINLNLNRHLLDWLQAFLSERTFQVKVQTSFSQSKIVKCGVPQGSVLSPVLFGIFVNEIPSILPVGVRCKQFADDIKLYASISKNDNSSPLQDAIEAICNWSENNRLSLNNNKTLCLTLGKRTVEQEYFISNLPIKRVSTTRDLGFIISEKLDFKEHWRQSANRAKFMLSQVFNQFCSSDTRLMTLLYKIFIRPHLEYGTPISSPHGKKTIAIIEAVQNAFTRRLFARQKGKYIRFDDPDYLTASERNSLFNLQSLTERRQNTDKKLVCKIIANKIDVIPSDFFTVTKNSRTRTRIKFSWTKCKTNIRRHFFVNRTLSLLSKPKTKSLDH